jgi:hypothetical protein
MTFACILQSDSAKGLFVAPARVLLHRSRKWRLKALPAKPPDQGDPSSKLDKPLRSDVHSLDASQIVQHRSSQSYLLSQRPDM